MPLLVLQQLEDDAQLKYSAGDCAAKLCRGGAQRARAPLTPGPWSVRQVVLRDHGFARDELPDDDWNIFWCAGQVNCP